MDKSNTNTETEFNIQLSKIGYILTNFSESYFIQISNYVLKENDDLNAFYCKPTLTLHKYLLCIAEHMSIEISTYILAVMYVDKFLATKCPFGIAFNLHKIYLTALTLACTYNEDKTYKVADFARIGGIPFKKLKFLLFVFVNSINHNLYVSKELFYNYQNLIFELLLNK